MKHLKVADLLAAVRNGASAILAVAIAIVGAIALSNWAACEQYDQACLISTSTK